MVKWPSFFLFSLIFFQVFSQQKTIIYFFPGQGADHRLFDSLRLDARYERRVIAYPVIPRRASMQAFAKLLVPQIDTSRSFILCGVSMGGMLCVELSEILHPVQTIIISSARNRKELPFRYRFQRWVPLYGIFPGSWLVFGARLLQPLVEPDRNKNKETFKSMLSAKDGTYMKRSISMIVHWSRRQHSATICQVHGDSDHTIPFRNIRHPDYIVAGGSHMMTLTRAREISSILNEILKR